jgi:hypothetical protein
LVGFGVLVGAAWAAIVSVLGRVLLALGLVAVAFTLLKLQS